MSLRVGEVILMVMGVIGVYGQMSSGQKRPFRISFRSVAFDEYYPGVSELSIDNQVPIANDGYVNVGDLGDYFNGPYLLCHTDNVECCSSRQVRGRLLGEWYLPNGTAVGNFGEKKWRRGINLSLIHI